MGPFPPRAPLSPQTLTRTCPSPLFRTFKDTMSYFRRRFSSFEEFQREGLADPIELGKDELELIEELEADDDFYRRPARRRKSWWD
jgi:hypothetical protein